MKRVIAIIISLLLGIMPVYTVDVGVADATQLLNISTTTLTGENVTGEIFFDYPLTIMHYFATWSGDCIRELGYMQTALEEFGDNINVLGILHEDATSTAEACLELFEELGLNYPVLHLCEELQNLVSQNNYIPQTFIVDSKGYVVYSFIGTFSDYEALGLLIKEYLPSDIQHHTVSFYDDLTDELIASERVIHGGSAVPPQPPVHSGYEFTYWSGNYQSVTHDEIVKAMYAPIDSPPFLLGDANCDGIINVSDATVTARYALGFQIEDGKFDFDAADYNCNDIIELADASLILRAALGF